MALLRREAGFVEPRVKPGHIEADYFDPAADRASPAFA
jgi:hypothetical protein